jgi:beta-barrel assembly-enhancing protease
MIERHPYINGFMICLVILGLALPHPASAITIQEEEELSREFLKVVREHFDVIDDPYINRYIESVGERILAQMPPQPFKYHFYVINEPTYNAFAAPAGHIFINSGLIEAMTDEAELAGIMAHEISHVVCRHISEKIERSTKISLATLAGIAAGVFLGAGGAAAAANAVSIGSMAAGQSLSLAYSREDERQADQLALSYLKDADYDAGGLLAMLKKIRDKSWFGPESIPTYLSTHPAVDERIAHVGSWIETHSPALTTAGAEAFRKAHARMSALYGDPAAALQNFRSRVESADGDPMAHYGYGLALARNGRRSAAVAHLQTALKKRAFDPQILADLGRIYFLDGDYEAARKTLNGAISIDPKTPDALFYLGRTRMATGDYPAAVEHFEKLLKIYPSYPRGLYFLGEAYGRIDVLDQAHYYLGLHYKEAGDPVTALFHLKRAAELTQDSEKVEAIRKLLKSVGKAAARERMAEKEEVRSRRRLVPISPGRTGQTAW